MTDEDTKTVSAVSASFGFARRELLKGLVRCVALSQAAVAWGAKANSKLEDLRLPENTSLEIYGKPPPLPAVNRIKGGGLIASMGVTSDQPVADLGALMHEADVLIGDVLPNLILSDAQKLSDAFLDTSKTTNAPAIIWVLNPKVFAMWSEGATLLQRLIYRWVSDMEAGIMAILYVQEPNSVAGALLVTILGELGVTTRGPDTDGSIVAAVQRADGIVVTCLLGPKFSPTGGNSEWFEYLSHSRCQAIPVRNESMCSEIDEELKGFLDTKLMSIREGVSKVPDIAPYLRGLMWEAASGGEIAKKALSRCLIEREAHLIFAMDESTHSAMFTEWPNHGHGLEVFPDLFLLKELLIDIDPDRTQTMGDLPSVDLIKWLITKNAGLAIRLGDPEEPTRVLFFDPDSLASMLRDYQL